MSSINREPREWLVWFERVLLCLGAATAAWCAAAWLETQYIQRFAVPRSSAYSMPGDSGATPRGTSGHRTSVEIGAVVARLEARAVSLSTAVLEGSDDAILNRAAGSPASLRW
jgi:hypothetical protein